MSHGNRLSTASFIGQGLIQVYTELVRHQMLGVRTQFLKGIRNFVADDVSRPADQQSLDSFQTHVQQLYQKRPFLKTYGLFLPSAELKLLVFSRLFTGCSPEPPVIPKVLGQIVPAESITSCSLATWDGLTI